MSDLTGAGIMLGMAKRTTKSTPATVPPSRKNIKYVPIPKPEWEQMKALGKPQERSVAFMVKTAVREFIERHGQAGL